MARRTKASRGYAGMRLRWTIRELMVVILIIGLSMGLLRIRWGIIFALMAGGVVGCGLAPGMPAARCTGWTMSFPATDNLTLERGHSRSPSLTCWSGLPGISPACWWL